MNAQDFLYKKGLISDTNKLLKIRDQDRRIFYLDQLLDEYADNKYNTAVPSALESFWRVIATMIMNKKLCTKYFLKDNLNEVRIETEYRYTTLKSFTEKKVMIFICLPQFYDQYYLYCEKNNITNVIHYNQLCRELKTEPYYIGICKAKKIGGTAQRAFVFDSDLLPGMLVRLL